VRRSDDGGAGLGLAIVAAIAEAHGGRAVARDARGGGAIFEVVLPAR
jgi:signal transduction histidine kinase